MFNSFIFCTLFGVLKLTLPDVWNAFQKSIQLHTCTSCWFTISSESLRYSLLTPSLVYNSFPLTSFYVINRYTFHACTSSHHQAPLHQANSMYWSQHDCIIDISQLKVWQIPTNFPALSEKIKRCTLHRRQEFTLMGVHCLEYKCYSQCLPEAKGVHLYKNQVQLYNRSIHILEIKYVCACEYFFCLNNLKAKIFKAS